MLYRIRTNYLRLYRIVSIRSGERNIQLPKAIQYNIMNINQVHLVSIMMWRDEGTKKII